jgi:hypothetical protein
VRVARTGRQVENLNQKIKTTQHKVLGARLTKYIFCGIKDVDLRLIEFINNYNMNAKLKTLGYLSPKDYLLKEHT